MRSIDDEEEEIRPGFNPMRHDMERELKQISALLAEQNFANMDEAISFLSNMTDVKKAGSLSSKKKASKSEQAQDLVFAALQEPSQKKRVEMAQQAIQLVPDCADAYNLLADNASNSPKEAAYYYRQGMEAGKRQLGDKIFREDKGYFWGIKKVPEFIGFGDNNEAVYYAQTHNHLWQSKPELLRWIASRA